MRTNPLADDLDHILNHTEGLWDELRGQRIFITGGTGFFGCWLLESFVWANDKLNLNCHATVLTRSPDSFWAKAPHLAGHSAVTVMEGNTCTFDFPTGMFSHIIHAATETRLNLPNIDPLLKFTSNIDGTCRVLDFARISGVRKFLFTSSGAVYGKQPSEMTHIPEYYVGAPDPIDPNTAYGQSKRASEFLCTVYAKEYGLQTFIARCFTFIGPGLPLDSNFAIGNFIRDAMNGNPICITGDGTSYRSYLYAADLAIWLWTILFKGQSCHPYNVGSENDLTVTQLAQMVAKTIDPNLPIQIARKHIEGQPIERYVPMTQRAKTEIGLQEFVRLPDAIHRTVRWHASFIHQRDIHGHD